MSNVPPPTTPPVEPTELTPQQRRIMIAGVMVFVIIVALLGGAVYLMVQPQNATFTAAVRDIFIIFMAIESLFIGLALVILMIQIARLTNLLQHEIKPILQNTNETVSTVRSTVIFVSENLVDPVMKLNGYVAALGKFFELINVFTKK